MSEMKTQDLVQSELFPQTKIRVYARTKAKPKSKAKLSMWEVEGFNHAEAIAAVKEVEGVIYPVLAVIK